MLMAVVMINIIHHQFRKRSWVSSVCIVSDYKLDDQVSRVRSLAGAKDFSLAFVSKPVLRLTQGTRGPFPGVKVWPERDADHSPPPL
jgi:hypothetical protein